jgi:D-cysteine desulfhydrase
LLLDHLLKATIHYAGAERKGESLTRIAERLEREGRNPCIIPYGGSNAIGARGFVDAAEELSAQVQERKIELNRIIFPSSSGGTHAGLMVGSRLHGLSAQIIGIAIDKGEAGDKPFDQHIADIANETRAFYSLAKDFSVSDVNLAKGYLGEGYGVVGDMEREAIHMLASLEGILLDPVYTGRAMGGLIDMIRRREIDSGETVLFWHTGGAPALFSYAADLVA